MTVCELTADQMTILKQFYLIELLSKSGKIPSWGELADADSLVDDSVIFDYYGGTIFSEDDF